LPKKSFLWRFAISLSTDIAIIGAGPYGLSIAAYLRNAGVAFRIFGDPMSNWRKRMPKGMHLKSDGFASSLFDPGRHFTLAKYCAEKGLPYQDLGLPVPLETFWSYGLAFQKQLVPSLDTRLVTRLERNADGFSLTMSDGAVVSAKRVIVATGISYYENLPAELQGLPIERCSHAADNGELDKYKGQEVVVLGRGASATDIAALLWDQGARVKIVSRQPIDFNIKGTQKTLWQRMREPNFGLGPSFRSTVYTLFPNLFRLLPVRLRQRIVKRHLGPAAVYFIRDKLEANVPMLSGYELKGAQVIGAKIELRFIHRDGSEMKLIADHVIAGTGYKVDLKRLPFLGDALREQIRQEGTSPALSANFECSVRGLYFVGIASAVTFGPLTRFAHGAGYTARRISAHLRRRRSPDFSEKFSGAHS
jgi:cation diffusion facilitator CzcD-associated flavoprotein CzcO